VTPHPARRGVKKSVPQLRERWRRLFSALLRSRSKCREARVREVEAYASFKHALRSSRQRKGGSRG